ncbi:hypothetical protein ScPMuIL_006983 [Solemya velum]
MNYFHAGGNSGSQIELNEVILGPRGDEGNSSRAVHRQKREGPEWYIETMLGKAEEIPLVGSIARALPKFVSKRIEVIKKLRLSPACKEDTLKLYDDFAHLKPYAVKMFDATSKLPAAIFEGRWIWAGDYEQCQDAISDIIPETGRAIAGRHCFNEIILPKKIAKIFKFKYLKNPQFGSCQPKTCTRDDVLRLVRATLGDFGVKLKRGKCEKPLQYTAGSIVAMSVIGVFLFLMTVGSAIELVKMCLAGRDSGDHEEKSELTDPVISVVNGVEVATAYDIGIDIHEKIEQEELRDATCVNCGSRVTKFFLCFSLINNLRKMMSIPSQKSELSALNGIRVISTIWVIQGHMYQLIQQFTDNSLPYQEIRKRFDFQAVLNGTYSVDSFLLLSGLLVTYVCLKKLKQKNGKLNWGMFYFHRFWRLTPTFAFVLMGYINLRLLWYLNPVKYLKYQDISHAQCSTNWWANLLYVNNFYFWFDRSGKESDCMYWSWYLAVDMQCYIFSPIIIYLLYKKRRAGIGLSVFLILLCLALRAIIVEHYNILDPNGGATEHFETIYKHDRVLYDKPYTRMAPYLVGMILASILYTTKCKVKINKAVVVLGWLIAATTGMAVIYGRFGYTSRSLPMEEGEAIAYLTLSRFCWAMAVSWVIFACATGYGGAVNAILSWNVWVPLGRMSYCAYLVHPILLTSYNIGQPTMSHYTDFHYMLVFLGCVFATYVSAGAVSLLVEGPFMRLEKLLFTGEDDSNRANRKPRLELKPDTQDKKTSL